VIIEEWSRWTRYMIAALCHRSCRPLLLLLRFHTIKMSWSISRFQNLLGRIIWMSCWSSIFGKSVINCLKETRLKYWHRTVNTFVKFSGSHIPRPICGPSLINQWWVWLLQLNLLESIIHLFQLLFCILNVLVNYMCGIWDVIHSWLLAIMHLNYLLLIDFFIIFVIKYRSLKFFNLLLVESLLTGCLLYNLKLLLEWIEQPLILIIFEVDFPLLYFFSWGRRRLRLLIHFGF
jgi:hypothetical protein